MLERKAPAPAAKPDPLPERSAEDPRPGPSQGRPPSDLTHPRRGDRSSRRRVRRRRQAWTDPCFPA